MEEMIKMPTRLEDVVLGAEYQDVVHPERKGRAFCVSRHLTGCDRIGLSFVKKDGDEVGEWWLDVNVVVMTDGPRHTRELPTPEATSAEKGGPQSNPPSGPLR